MTDTLLVCPKCESNEVLVFEEHAVDANTFEHFCLSVKAHDPDARARCLTCDWTGRRGELQKGAA